MAILRKMPPGYRVLTGITAALLALLALDLAGWPFLAEPLSRVLGKMLDRPVSVAPVGTRFHFIGGVRVESPHLRIAAAPWTQDPYFLDGSGLRLHLAYTDLWHAWRGAPLAVRSLEADRIQIVVRREAGGRGSWPLGDKAAQRPERQRGLPAFGHLEMRQGRVDYQDDRLSLKLGVNLNTREGTAAGEGQAPGQARTGLQADFAGSYREISLAGRLTAGGILPLVSDGSRPLPMTLEARVGSNRLGFSGTATDVLRLGGLQGSFHAAGPSLASVGEPLGLTLPATGAFRIHGRLQKGDRRWHAKVERAVVGGSQLAGNLVYDTRTQIPRLTGEVSGRRVLLADLAPSIGGSGAETRTGPAGGVLPDKSFDLPALRRMDADLRIAVSRLELGRVFARPIAPLSLRLILADGVLSLKDVRASTADGSLEGELSLDGRASRAEWRADLGWQGVNLAQWVRQGRKPGNPPYISGSLQGRLKATGRGRSIAEILAGMDGEASLQLRHGRLSHLAVEAAGLDVAQALGMAIKGDESLPVSCGAARFRAKDGIIHTEAAVLDTPDSTLSMDGQIRLDQERLQLRVVALPKDFSPLSLRTPILIRGSLSKPEVSLERGELAMKLGAGALLAIVSPWAALIPLLDPGVQTNDKGTAPRPGCQDVLKRVREYQQARPASD